MWEGGGGGEINTTVREKRNMKQFLSLGVCFRPESVNPIRLSLHTPPENAFHSAQTGQDGGSIGTASDSRSKDPRLESLQEDKTN